MAQKWGREDKYAPFDKFCLTRGYIQPLIYTAINPVALGAGEYFESRWQLVRISRLGSDRIHERDKTSRDISLASNLSPPSSSPLSRSL